MLKMVGGRGYRLSRLYLRKYQNQCVSGTGNFHKGSSLERVKIEAHFIDCGFRYRSAFLVQILKVQA